MKRNILFFPVIYIIIAHYYCINAKWEETAETRKNRLERDRQAYEQTQTKQREYLARIAERNTPLHQVVSQNKINDAGALLQKGVNVNAKDFHGRTSLHIAVKNANVAMIDLLIKYNAKTQEKDNHGLTPLDYVKSDISFWKNALKTGAGNRNILIEADRERRKEIAPKRIIEFQKTEKHLSNIIKKQKKKIKNHPQFE